MYPTTILEWWFNDQWNEIGWRAYDPKSAADLREHGARLAADGGHYRLVHPSIYRDGPPEVVHHFAAVGA